MPRNTLKPGTWNEVTGKKLITMGFTTTDAGKPLSNTTKYRVWIGMPYRIEKLKKVKK